MRKSFILFLFSAAVFQLKAQDKIDRAIENLEQNYTQEKVYLLLDKDKYVVGDNIYFKSFVFNGYGRSAISSTLFVELYDHNKNLVDKKTLFLKDGEGDGTFVLNEFLNEEDLKKNLGNLVPVKRSDIFAPKKNLNYLSRIFKN
jgi:hypothetical protein